MSVTIEADGSRLHRTGPADIGTFAAAGEQDSQGSKVVGDDTVPLTTSDIPCEYVWIAAPTANHTAGVNTGNILIGTASGGNEAGGITLANDRYEGIAYPIKNANLVYLTGFNGTDNVEYQIFKKA